MKSFEPPYIGAAYYPEVWDKNEVDKDIERMGNAGINLARIAEFAWSDMEPEEGRYDFGWLHDVMSKLEKKGIAAVLCTPTAAPPAWLTGKYPETLLVKRDGTRFVHGGRRHYCHNSAVYREFSAKITEKMAREFSHYKNLVGWQIDNEFGCHAEACYCDGCRDKFQKWLKTLYGAIETLNEKWGTGIWSQRYNDFSQIPLCKEPVARHHPSLMYRFRHFMSATYSEFAGAQAAIIRKHSKAPITTNGMPPVLHPLDCEDMFAGLDFVSNDIYWPPQELSRVVFEFDWMRPLKKKPCWLMETSATWAGGLVPASIYVHNPGSLRAKMWLAYSLGGEAVSFWLFRAHWSGQEMEHGSVIYSWGKPTLAEREIKQVNKELALLANVVNSTKVERAGAAIHYSTQSKWVFDYGPVAAGFKYDQELAQYHKMFLNRNIQRDLIYPNSPVNEYKVVCSPYLPVMTDALLLKMKKFVMDGGIWIVGPMSAMRTEDATAHKNGAIEPIENLLGIQVRHRFPPAENARVKWGSKKIRCHWWCDAFEESSRGKVLAKYFDGPAKGMAAVIEGRLGKGKVVLLGTMPDPDILGEWMAKYCGLSAHPAVSSFSQGVLLVPRAGSSGKTNYMFMIETAGKAGKVCLKKKSLDLITKESRKEFLLKPFDVKVLEL